MRKVVFRDGTATACERTGDAPAAASVCRAVCGAFTVIGTGGATRAGSWL